MLLEYLIFWLEEGNFLPATDEIQLCAVSAFLKAPISVAFCVLDLGDPEGEGFGCE